MRRILVVALGAILSVTAGLLVAGATRSRNAPRPVAAMPSESPAAAAPEAILATVGDREITLADLERFMRVRDQLAPSYGRKRALEELIERTLLHRLAEAKHLQPAEREIESALLRRRLLLTTGLPAPAAARPNEVPGARSSAADQLVRAYRAEPEPGAGAPDRMPDRSGVTEADLAREVEADVVAEHVKKAELGAHPDAAALQSLLDALRARWPVSVPASAALPGGRR